MSLKKVSNIDALALKDDASQILIAIDNGDLKALESIIEAWGFKDVESALRFAIAVLTISKEEKIIQVKGKDGETSVSPADTLLKTKNTSSNSSRTSV